MFPKFLKYNLHVNCRHIKFCKQNTAMLIVLRENYLCKTSTQHRKNSKQNGIDSCFALFRARAVYGYNPALF